MTREQAALLEVSKSVINNHRIAADCFQDMDWSILINLLQQHKIFALTYENLSHVIPDSLKESCETIYQNHVGIIDERMNEIKLLFNKAKEMDVNIVLNKGIALSIIIYEDAYKRDSRDIDLLINENEMDKINELLSVCGFHSAIGNKNTYHIDRKDPDDFFYLDKPILKSPDSHEFFEYWKQTHSGRYVVLETGRHLHQSIKEITSFLESTQFIHIQGNENVKTLDLEHSCIALLENAFNDAEGFDERIPALKNYIDIAMFVKKYEQNMNWDNLNKWIAKYELNRESALVIKQIKEIFAGADLSFFDYIRIDEAIDHNKSFYEWDISITERLFLDGEQRKKMIALMSKKAAFSDHNKNYCGPIKTNDQQWRQLLVNDDKFDLHYNFEYEANHLVLRLNLSESTLNSLTENQEIIIFLINPNLDCSDYFTHQVIIRKENNRLQSVERSKFAHVREEDVLQGCSNFQNDNGSLSIYLPYENLGSGDYIGYFIGVIDNLLGRIPHWQTAPPYHKDFWTSMPVLEVVDH
ncbi:nucleotidyltransferase family protein [Paenibacillus algorifonticola]|uniref:nucleotidyltransferase family protein n=1 Tax=Paenibacillus algorifonticola TaxID=684063 RepID=UPI0015A566E5|nr:nucleotidyltransferase family protein [Paenibacillus algorifonticola]